MATSISNWPFCPSAINASSTRLFRIHYENGLEQPYITYVEDGRDEKAKGHLVSIDFSPEQLEKLKVCVIRVLFWEKGKLTLYRVVRPVILLRKHCATLSVVKVSVPI